MIQCSAKRWKFNIYLLEESLKGGLRNFLAIQSEENIHILKGVRVTHINKGKLKKIKLLLFNHKHE